MFSTQSDNCTPFVHIFDIIFLFAAELEEPKIGIWGKWLMFSKAFSDRLIKLEIVKGKLFTTNPDFYQPWTKKAFENIVGKAENIGNQHFLLFT